MHSSGNVLRSLGERLCLVAWVCLMMANTIMIGLSVELIVFGVILSLDQINLIDDRTLPFLIIGFIAVLNFPFVMKLHGLGMVYLNFGIHENVLNNATESWGNLITTLIDETSLRSRQLEKLVRAINDAESAAERQERRREAKAWLIENKEKLTDADKEIVLEHLGYLKVD